MTKRRFREAQADLPPAAGNGLLDRRLFLEYGAVFGALLLTPRPAAPGAPTSAFNIDPADPPWMHQPGKPFSHYGVPSPHESKVIRWIAANPAVPGNGVSWSPLHDLEGTITPTGLHFERHHNGVPDIDPAQHRLVIHGLTQRALSFTMDDLMRYPMRSALIFLECGGNSNQGWNLEPIQTKVSFLHGLVSCGEWTGVPLSILLDEAGIDAGARWLIAEGADAIAMNVSIPIEKAFDDAILAVYQNGERIRPEHGYPLRLVLPGWEGVMNVKWLRRLRAAAEPVMARNETSRYTELLPSGKARQFTFVMETKSVITAPSFGMTLEESGFYEISGLAWSGRGRVRSVEVSADGGRSWAPAALQEPVLSKCFTRFRIPWRWDGGPATLMSRATDETGSRQPLRADLVRERGRQGYFHYHAVVSWAVGEDGLLRHVYI
ncbi:MAG: sulfite dehydrogenase [Gammaproteobacteria bacterium]|nr:sulfite dehydrogenase [Gammaproteobacteria bacterium]